MRLHLWLAIFVAVLAANPARAEPRVALVVGNSAYKSSLNGLANPVNDAELMAKVLKQTGFEVELVKDADQKTLKRAIVRLGARLSRAGTGSTGLFFYAGHGLQSSRGVNYLVPIDADIVSESDIDIESVPAQDVLNQMEDAGTGTSIVILDACRNTPVMRKLRGATRGLAEMHGPKGSFIAYSTGVGQTANDGDGMDSPFVVALAKQIAIPNQPIEAVFRNVATEVGKATGEMQEPWTASSLLGDGFTFTVKVTVTATVNGVPSAATAPAFVVPGIQARDFSTVPTATAPAMTVSAAPYLHDGAFGLKVRDLVPAGSELIFVNNRRIYDGRAIIPTVSQNMLMQQGTNNVPASFTLELSRPAASVRFLVPRLYPDTKSGVTFPAWTATAFSASGAELDSRHKALARRMDSDIPGEVIVLTAPAFEGISAVRFQSDPRLNGVPFAGFSTILLEGVWIEPMRPAEGAR